MFGGGGGGRSHTFLFRIGACCDPAAMQKDSQLMASAIGKSLQLYKHYLFKVIVLFDA